MTLEIPAYPESVPLSLGHKPIIDGLNTRLENNSALTNFSNNFIMDMDNSVQLSLVSDSMVIDIGDQGAVWLGNGDKVVDFVAKDHHQFKIIKTVDCVAEKSVIEPDNAEYLYLTQSTRKMEGQSYEGMRRKINQFHNCGSALVEPHRIGDLDQIWKMTKDWYDEEKPDQAYSRSLELIALEKTLSFWEALGLEIWVLRLGGVLIGYMVLEQIAKKTVLIHFFKTQREISGAAEFLFWSIADLYADRSDLINFEQDLGLKGLKQFKESLRPVDKITICRIDC